MATSKAVSCALRAPELLLFCVPKREVTKRKRHPAAALSGLPALRVREPWPGFSAGHRARSKRRCHPWQRPLRGLIVHASPPPRGPKEQARILRARSTT